MVVRSRLATAGLLAFLALARPTAADQYVATNGTGTVPPFDSWANATTSIVAAVAAATAGENVWVSNGTYVLTGATIPLASGVSLRGLDPATTIIQAASPTNRLVRLTHADALCADLTIRGCTRGGIYMSAGTVSNCWVLYNTLNAYQQNGAGIQLAGGLVTRSLIAWNTNAYGGQSAGGVLISGGTLQHSAIASNRAAGAGGGIAISGKSLVRNCLIAGNRAIDIDSGSGGGVSMGHAQAVLESCTIVSNQCSPERGGGGLVKSAGLVTNTIVSANRRGAFIQDIDGTSGGTGNVAFSCAPELTAGINGNLSADPQFVDPAGDFRLGPGSPCIDAGTNVAWMDADALDLGGQPRKRDGNGDADIRADMGCHEAGPLGSGALRCAFAAAPDRGYVSLQAVFTASADGADSTVTWYGWDFDNNGSNELAGAGLQVVTNTFAPGLYDVRLTVSNASLEGATWLRPGCVKVDALEYFVATNGSHTAPYSSWATAATNLRTVAEYARADGSTGVAIRVGPGTYNESAAVVLWQPVQVVAEQGPSNTALRWPAAGDRVVKIQNPGCLLSGFTVKDGRWGGALIESGTISNCWLIANVPFTHWINGGGLRQTGGLVTHSLVGWNTNHTANGQAAGAYMTGGTLAHSVICSNIARSGSGGGVQLAGAALVRNCLIAGNQTTVGAGGGAYVNSSGAVLENCTVAGNRCPATQDGGGINKPAGSLTNVVVYGNLKDTTPQDLVGTNKTFFSCAPELDTGPFGNTGADPRFVDEGAANYRLDVGSPCIDAGSNGAWMAEAADVEGAPRLVDGDGNGSTNVDMGCFEASAPGAGPFQVNFAVDPAVGYLALDAVFTAAAGGGNTNVIRYDWDFNNDGSNELSGPLLGVVTNPFGLGFFTVKLTAENSDHDTATYTASNCVKVYPVTYYAATNGSATPPYDSWETAASDIGAILGYAYADGSTGVTVRVGTGAFTITDPLVLNRRLELVSENGPQATTIRWPGAPDRLIKLTHADARLTGFTVTGANQGALLVQNGIVSNCWLVHNTPNTHWIYGGGVSMSGGLVTHSVIGWNTNNTVNNHSAGAYVTGGRLQNSVIRNNTARSGSGGGVGVSGSGCVRTCLIIRNESVAGSGGGVWMNDGGLLENCTIATNVCADAGAGGGVYLTKTTGQFGWLTNTIVWANASGAARDDIAGGEAGYLARIFTSCAQELTPGSNGNLAADPLFRAPGVDLFRPFASSPCLNTGANTPWMAAATDLDGRPRILEGQADMGAYEVVALGGALILVQ